MTAGCGSCSPRLSGTCQQDRIGADALYAGDMWKVLEKHVRLARGEFRYTYLLGKSCLAASKKTYNPLFAGRSIHGTVIASGGDCVKLHLEIDRIQDVVSAYPYPWVPDTGSVMYCMPEKGTTVSLYFPDGDERNAIAVNCIRYNGATCSEMADTSKRALATTKGKRMYLETERIGMDIKDSGHKASMEDGTGISMESGTVMSISAVKGMKLNAKTVTIETPGALNLLRDPYLNGGGMPSGSSGDPYEDEGADRERKDAKRYRGFKSRKHIGERPRKEMKPAEQKTKGWYSDIAAGTAVGSATSEIFVLSTGDDKMKYPDIYVYDGLPWEPDDNTYFFDLRKARGDVWPLYEQAGISQKELSSMLMSSDVDTDDSAEVEYSGKYAVAIDGIPALGVGVWPAMWKNYYPKYPMKTIEMDDISANWTYKIAIVVVDKGVDVNDRSQWKYVPATRISAKGHTFYGGVMQTNATLKNGNIVATKKVGENWKNTTVKHISEYGSDEKSIVQMLKDIQAVNGMLGDFWLHYVETYNIEKKNMNRINENYDFARYVVYGGTFKNMS